MKINTSPVKHLSARVPWHDNMWNGTVCNDPVNNSFCRVLKRIDINKDPLKEAEKCNCTIDDSLQPPCVSEKGTFLSPNAFVKTTKHPWKEINQLFKDTGPGNILFKPFSFNAVPYQWIMKNKATDDFPHYSAKAEEFELEYNPDSEDKIDKQLGFEGNTWIQDSENVKSLFDGFFNSLEPQNSLIFFYAKHSPFSEPPQRIIIGVAKVRSVGQILEYEYPKDYNGHRAYLWDRIIQHTLTDKSPEGFLLPYHKILQHQKENGIDLELSDFAVIAPNFEEFSYAAELVSHDTAIDSLFLIAEHLKKTGELLKESFEKELKWIDEEVSKIWDMRGGFPGMGPVLSCLKINNGNTIAWEIEKFIIKKDGNLLITNPWSIFENSIKEPKKHLGKRGIELFDKTLQTRWRFLLSKKKEFLKLLSRCQLTNIQVKEIYDMIEHEKTSKYLENFYLVYEKTRNNSNGCTFTQIDKALLPAEKIRKAFPLPVQSKIEDLLDLRRIRAVVIDILEDATAEGHTLLPLLEICERINDLILEHPIQVSRDILNGMLQEDFFKSELFIYLEDEDIKYVKLFRMNEIKLKILESLSIDTILNPAYKIEHDWLELVNDYPLFAEQDKETPPDETETKSREEKAAALEILSNYKVSVLIGPAGTGKTTLLEIFENIPEIRRGGVVKLAPTGKARVKLGHDAQTIGQYLYPERYNVETGVYFMNDEAPKDSNVSNIIIDEASMITEDQLAALLDKLSCFERIIFVGDYRQLPPIGAGRPLVDLVNIIKPKSFKGEINVGPAYAELKQIHRQVSGKRERIDVILSRCFCDEINKNDIEKTKELLEDSFNNEYIRLEKWYDTEDLYQLIERVIKEELNLSETEPEKDFNRWLGGVDHNGYQYFNCGQAENEIENWQIITPNNGYAFGVKEVNKFIQKTYRQKYLDLANQRFRRRIPKPVSQDNFVYGDKVINLRNKWRDKIRPASMGSKALNYVANGEIGVVTGYLRSNDDINNNKYLNPRIEIAFSTQPGYSYTYLPYELDNENEHPFELAYAITIHKSQGSGFKKVFLILPAHGQVLSRELLYTALTRQEEKIIILHQGDFREFLKFSSSLASSTASRFTDLFTLPEIKKYENKTLDPRYVNVSERGELMISKSEVIIANGLNKYKKNISYAYEDKLKLDSYEKEIKPDFTIKNSKTGKVFYWEHCGMMTNSEYRERWKMKLKAYQSDGFVHFNKAKTKDKKILIVTEDNVLGGVDSQYFDEIIKKYILG